MIKLYLPQGLNKDKKIVEIFNRIACKIFERSSDKLEHMFVVYSGEKKRLNSIDAIRGFLLSENFYNYKFETKSDFIRDLLNLPPNVYIGNVLINSSRSEKVRKFCSLYDKTTHKEDYERLINYREFTVAKLKNDATHPDVIEYKHITDIFSYNLLNDRDRHELLDVLNIPVCPYCNMNYVFNFEHKNGRRSTADIDHFYLKSKYPEYALCLYNFVPACQVCNQKIKGTHDVTIETHLYPFQEGSEGICQFKITNLLECLMQTQDEADIELDTVESNIKARNTIEDFQLNERYKHFSYYAKEWIEKVLMYNDAYVESLSESFGGLVSEVEMKHLIFGNPLSEEEYGKVSLGKLKQDLLNQLGVFNM